MEDLHNSGNLETVIYMTENTKSSDIFWDRESGLRINVGISGIHLIPHYEDVDHESDNKYMLSNPNHSEDKTKFRHAVRNYCR